MRMTRASRRLSTVPPPRTTAFYPDVAFGALVPAVFLSRPNRFLVLALIGERRVAAASRDPGRLSELLVPGAQVLLAAADPTGRRTSYTLMLVRRGRLWVPLVPALANRILEAALLRSGAHGLAGARILRRE